MGHLTRIAKYIRAGKIIFASLFAWIQTNVHTCCISMPDHRIWECTDTSCIEHICIPGGSRAITCWEMWLLLRFWSSWTYAMVAFADTCLQISILTSPQPKHIIETPEMGVFRGLMNRITHPNLSKISLCGVKDLMISSDGIPIKPCPADLELRRFGICFTACSTCMLNIQRSCTQLHPTYTCQWRVACYIWMWKDHQMIDWGHKNVFLGFMICAATCEFDSVRRWNTLCIYGFCMWLGWHDFPCPTCARIYKWALNTIICNQQLASPSSGLCIVCSIVEWLIRSWLWWKAQGQQGNQWWCMLIRLCRRLWSWRPNIYVSTVEGDSVHIPSPRPTSQQKWGFKLPIDIMN